MAGMRLFGRRCTLATDDFFFIGIIQFILFLPWIGWVPMIYASFLKQRSKCIDQDVLLLLDISLPCLCLLFLINWLLSILFIIFSSRGTIANPEPRQPVVTLVYIKLFVTVLDIASATLGTVILVKNTFCDIYGVGFVLKICSIFQWSVILIRMSMMIIFYDLSFSRNPKETETSDFFNHPVNRRANRKWQLRLQAVLLFFTTATEERKQAFKIASELLAIMSWDLDLTVSDLLAGVLILRRKGKLTWKSEKTALSDHSPIMTSGGVTLEKFPPVDFEPWMNFQNARHFFQLGFGVFGWVWYVFRNLACGFCILFGHLKCCFPMRKRAHIIEGDNCCGCDVTGLQLQTNLLYDDLVFVSFKDTVFEIPFFVALDHQTASILVAARGSMSGDDFLTDVYATFEKMDDIGIPPGTLCHGGLLNAARHIKMKMEERNVLDDAFRERPNYRLVFTGHSLGAAVASILTMLYKHQYNDARCFAFAPPPTVNDVILPYVEKNIFTIFYGNDVVGCINFENVQRAVRELVESLETCNIPKYKVFMSNRSINKDLESAEPSRNSSQDILLTNGISKAKYTTEKNSEAINVNKEIAPQPVPPINLAGKIVHIYPQKQGYRLKITTPDNYRKIIFRPNMIFHHIPIYIEKAIEDLSKLDVLDAKSLIESSS